ncbi:hypothetical protein RMN57_17255 [Kitasatospora sp. CM 4170]|uniref:Uncharacterized protein n=1 Tax=Kitasatospora aburaviensis TaxID=67265 RepID=A0ABW1EWN7_9ACTN|nr:hypothetical protein [Kitasatospora sp. CM 4170]WNM46323.1 hypothetical protein RMN57_17255 [Kitasatospora sp. CM 4170]
MFPQAFPGAGIVPTDVEEPRGLAHPPNESVDPGEVEHKATVQASFLRHYAAPTRS